MTELACVRSFLFVPAASEKLIDSALKRSCDAVILDLEDGTHPRLRSAARAGLVHAFDRIKEVQKIVAVRINGDLLTAVQDLQAAVWPGLDILVLPKVEHPRDVQLLCTAISALEEANGLVSGHVRLLLQIESAQALPRLHDIAASHSRVMGMMLGSEDFSLDCGGLPTPDALLVPSIMVLHAARSARIQPIGFVGSIADLGSPEEFKTTLERARALGFRGAVVVHPKFVDVVNSCFTPTPEQLTQARKVVEAFKAADAEGLGAIRVDGQMIDKPVFKRALALLAEARPTSVLDVR